MTPTEVINEIQKMPVSQMREVVEKATSLLREQEQAAPTPEEVAADLERREREFERKMFEIGFFASIPTRDETDEDDDFEPIEFEGEPLSEMIIRERR